VLGPLNQKRYAIESGLTEDDWVITNGQMRAIPGKKVTPVKAGEQKGTNAP